MRFSGIIPALVTPFDDQDQVDGKIIESLIERLIQQGINGLFICGSTAEWWVLDAAERKRIAEIAIRTVNGRIPVMIHIGANATRDAIDLARHAEKIGADAISALPPLGRPYPSHAMWGHFQEIGASCGLPLYLYHLPQVYGELITVDRFVQACDEMPTLAGAKFSSYQINHLIELKVRVGDRLNIISGCSEQLMSTLGAGADGNICTWHNIIPRLGTAICERMAANDVEGARKLQHLLVMFGNGSCGNGIAVIKLLVSRQGFPCGPPRKPSPGFSPAEEAAYLARLPEVGIEPWFI